MLSGLHAYAASCLRGLPKCAGENCSQKCIFPGTPAKHQQRRSVRDQSLIAPTQRPTIGLWSRLTGLGRNREAESPAAPAHAGPTARQTTVPDPHTAASAGLYVCNSAWITRKSNFLWHVCAARMRRLGGLGSRRMGTKSWTPRWLPLKRPVGAQVAATEAPDELFPRLHHRPRD
jgi:hypothetical protein